MISHTRGAWAFSGRPEQILFGFEKRAVHVTGMHYFSHAGHLGISGRPEQIGSDPKTVTNVAIAHLRDFPTMASIYEAGETRDRCYSGEKEIWGIRNTDPLSRRGPNQETEETPQSPP